LVIAWSRYPEQVRDSAALRLPYSFKEAFQK
jgi:hypothetical protein